MKHPRVHATILGWFFLGLLTASLIGIYMQRAPLSAYLWREHRILRDGALILNPDDALLRVNVGEHYLNVYDEGVYDLESAEKYFIKALQVDSNVPWAWYHLGHISFIRGNFSSALYRFNKQIELHGHQVLGTYYMRALTYAFDKQYDKAIADYEYHLREVYPDDVWGMNDLAWVYTMLGDFDRSLEVGLRGLEIVPDNVWLLTTVGVSLINLGQNEDALPYLEHAYERSLLLTPEDWGDAYPGNDPAIREESLAFMRETILRNITIAREI